MPPPTPHNRGLTFCTLQADDNRRVRFHGVEKNGLGLSLRVAAINLRRLITLDLDHDGVWVLVT